MDDALIALISGVTGWLVSRYWHTALPKPTEEHIVDAVPVLQDALSVVPTPRTRDYDYVRFTYADGRVRVKKFPVSEIYELMVFEGRRFKPYEWTPDGHVYREVMG